MGYATDKLVDLQWEIDKLTEIKDKFKNRARDFRLDILTEDFHISNRIERERASELLERLWNEDDTEGVSSLQGLSSFLYAYGMFTAETQKHFDRFIHKLGDVIFYEIRRYDLQQLNRIKNN